ncbi:restriction endonuclease subunit S [Streptosporangium sandarakinum]|uniref:restriction endonuclease subunit S n=1 Tax=Streptosporangium sandarakinum TaxID=1260955 RepID=UPI003D8DBA86
MSGADLAPWLARSKWPTVPIRYVAKLGTGHTPSRQHPEYWEDCTIPWITLADVWQLRDGTRDTVVETKEKISRLGLANSAAVLHPAGTVILSRTASVGFPAIMGQDMATSQDFATWTCGPKIEPRYLLHALRAMAPDLRRVAAGSTHKTIYMPDIEQLRVPLPSTEEQCRIADFLDSRVDQALRLQAMRAKQRLILDERAASLITEILVPGVAGDTWPWNWLPEMQDRPLVRLGYLCRLQSGITMDSSRAVDGDVVTRPYLRVANVQAGHVDLGSLAEVTVPRKVAERSMLRAGDVLMTEGGDLDKLGRGTVWRGEIEDCLHQNHVFALRPDPEKLDAEYLALMTQTLHGRCYFESTGVKTTNLASTNSSKILGFPVPLPAIEQQRYLVRQVEMQMSAIGRARRVLDEQSRLLRERQQALITAAVTGQIDVTTAQGVMD